MPTSTVYLFEIQAWTGAAVETLYIGTHTKTTSPSDTPANTTYLGCVSDPGSIKYSTGANGATFGPGEVDVGSIDLVNYGDLDDWLSYGWGHTGVMKELQGLDSPVSGATTLMQFTVVGIETPDALGKLRLKVRSRLAELDKPLLTSRYAGTTLSAGATVEGDESLKGQIKPYVFGSAPNVAGILVNRFDLVYQFAANGCTSLTVYDGGIALTLSADYATVAELVAATIADGYYSTCLTYGLVRLGALPEYAVTADVVEGATESLRSTSRVLQRILALVPTILTGDTDTDAFDDFHTFSSAEVGVVVSSDTKAIDVIGSVASSARASLVTTALGVFTPVWNSGPSATDVESTLTFRELINSGFQLFSGTSTEGAGVPAWSVVVKWGRIWKVMTNGDMALRLSDATDGTDLARKQYLSTEYQEAVAQDESVKTAYPLAVELVFVTMLTQIEDAEALAADLLELFSTRRDRLTFPTFFNDGNIELGLTVTVQLTNRLRFNAGKNMLVVSREDNYTQRIRVLTLWG